MNKIFLFAQLTFFAFFAVSANSAPTAFSINSDSGNTETTDNLYSINLANGSEQRRGELISGLQTRIDTEGLAISPNGILWGVDDDSRTLFPIGTANGSINVLSEVLLSDFPPGAGNDFGMTFGCDSSLYITSVRTRTLYHLNMDGSSEPIGAEGALGVNISAIAAIGSPTKLYGLGNGQLENGQTDAPNLYSIDIESGVATMIGPLGAQAGEYNQGGLAFDAAGSLWAITDRRIVNNAIADLPSQILRINTETGLATLISSTTEVGFESLAIAPPTKCIPVEEPVESDEPVEPEEPIEPGEVEDFQPIPTLSPLGRGLAIFLLLFGGLVILRKRSF